jgi:hypothetical protein
VGTECALISEGAACGYDCGGPPVAVTKAALTAYRGEIQAIRDDLCSGYPNDGCMPEFVTCTSIAYPSEAYCASGTCTLVPIAPDCATATQIGGEMINQVVAHTDNSCASDDDCVKYDADNDCYQFCGPLALSRSAKAEVAATNARIDVGVCSRFEWDSCTAPSLPCEMVAPFTPSCSNGTCVAKPIACDACLTENIAWGHAANINIGDESTVEGCRSYSRRTDVPMNAGVEPMTCQGELGTCGDGASTAFLLAALADEDVQVALNQGAAVFGGIGRADSQPLVIHVGSASIKLRDPCDPNEKDCVRPPRGVQALADTLKIIDESMTTTQCPEFAGFTVVN